MTGSKSYIATPFDSLLIDSSISGSTIRVIPPSIMLERWVIAFFLFFDAVGVSHYVCTFGRFGELSIHFP